MRWNAFAKCCYGLGAAKSGGRRSVTIRVSRGGRTARPPEVIMSQVEQTTRDRSAIAVAYQKPEFWAKGFGKLIFSNLLVLVMCVIPLELYFGSWVRPKPWGLLLAHAPD